MESNIPTNTNPPYQTYNWQSQQSQSDERTSTSRSATMKTNNCQQN
jgi:hypothetical protein